MKRNEWQARYGAARRAIDKNLCAEAEMLMALEGYGDAQQKLDRANRDNPADMAHAKAAVMSSLERVRIARAFGRPL